MKHWKFTGKEKECCGFKLKQIERISDGLIGGWIEKEKNLAQDGSWVYGNAWVSGNAQVSGNARVYGDAQVYGNARVYGDAQVSGNAQVSGSAWVSGNARVYENARVESNKDYVNIIVHPYSITLTKTYIQIGCQSQTFDEWMKVTRKEAIAMGFDKNYFSIYKTIIKEFSWKYFKNKEAK